MPATSSVLENFASTWIRSNHADLSLRHMGVFFTTYLQDDLRTVRGLASYYNVSKPTITRAIDRLSELGHVKRVKDPSDGRSILVERTDAGYALLHFVTEMDQSIEVAQIVHRFLINWIRASSEQSDLSLRYLGVLLTLYHNDGPHTVRSLASHFRVPKPAITRAIDRLAALGFAMRANDPNDRRSIVIQRTERGAEAIKNINEMKLFPESSEDIQLAA